MHLHNILEFGLLEVARSPVLCVFVPSTLIFVQYMGVEKGVLGGAQAPSIFGPVSSRDINGVLIKRGVVLDSPKK